MLEYSVFAKELDLEPAQGNMMDTIERKEQWRNSNEGIKRISNRKNK